MGTGRTADRTKYNASVADWVALRAEARAAAASTRKKATPALTYTNEDGSKVEALREYWQLAHRDWHKEERRGQITESFHDQITYALLKDGDLMVAVISEREVEDTERGYRRFSEFSHAIHEFTDDAMEDTFDFAPARLDGMDHGKNLRIWGNRGRGEQVLYDQRGAGLAAALRELREAK